MGEPLYDDFFAQLLKCFFPKQAKFLEANKTNYEQRIRDLMEYKKDENVEKFVNDVEAEYKKSLEKPKEPVSAVPPSKRDKIIDGTKERLSDKNKALGEYFSKNFDKYKGYINVMLDRDSKGDIDGAERFYSDMLKKVERDFEKTRTSA